MFMKRIKKEYKGQTLSNKNLTVIVNDVKPEDYTFLTKMGFGFIFEDVKETTKKDDTTKFRK